MAIIANCMSEVSTDQNFSSLKSVRLQDFTCQLQDRKISKISSSMYKSPPPRGACTWKIALKFKVKQSENVR